MSEQINIKINIADRVYPLKVTVEEEEEVRRAAKRLNDRIQQYKQEFEVTDKHDILAMCALEFASEAENVSHQKSLYQKGLMEKIEAIENLLNQ